MNKYETEKEEEYYLIVPTLSYNKIRLGEKVFYSDANEITTYDTREEWVDALKENGVDINDLEEEIN
tara:strand:- start:853 stop:1053 length:201 start_codon:yes stop_codon:yes gene_type:complete